MSMPLANSSVGRSLMGDCLLPVHFSLSALSATYAWRQPFCYCQEGSTAV